MTKVLATFLRLSNHALQAARFTVKHLVVVPLLGLCVIVPSLGATLSYAPISLGQFSTDGTGAASYSIPIRTMPGTAGLAPVLLLQYSNDNGAGDAYLAYGWKLKGLHSIKRCGQTPAQDGAYSADGTALPITYSSSDRYCLEDGQRLVAISGSYGADGTVYHTESESYTKIISYGQTGAGPTYFKAWTKSGQIIEFGNTADSKTGVYNSSIGAWMSNKVSDLKGNYYAVTYETVSGIVHPLHIDYTGNASTSLTPYYSVQFFYTGSLLDHIFLRNGTNIADTAQPIGMYYFTYSTGPTTAKSLLASLVYENGYSATFASETFGYQGGTASTDVYAVDLLTSITRTTGAAINVTYSIVTADTTTKRYAVSQVSQSNGLGGTNTSTYSSSGFVRDTQGRSDHGFSQITMTDSLGRTTTTSYGTTFPLTGLMLSQTVALSGVTLSSQTNTYSNTVLGTGTDGVTYRSVVMSQSNTQNRDANGAVLPSTVTSYSYDAYGNQTQIAVSLSDGSSKTTSNTYFNDTVNWILGQVTTSSVQSIVGSSNITRHVSYSHDSLGYITQQVVEPDNSAFALTTTYSYDAYGNVISSSVSGSGSTRTATSTYDTRGLFKTQECNTAGECHSYVRSAFNGAAPPPSSYSIADTDPNGLVTTTYYDILDRAVKIVYPDGNITLGGYGSYFVANTPLCTTLTIYSGPGCPTNAVYAVLSTPKATSAAPIGGVQNGAQKVVYYDMLGRVIATDTQGVGGAWIRVAQAYDAYGHVTQVSLPYFVSGGTPKWTTYAYDTLSRIISVAAPDGSVTVYGYNGLTTTVTNAKSQTTTTVRNAQGLVASVADAAGHATNYDYDAFGNTLKVTDAAGNIITNTYDVRGNKVATTDPDLGSWSYSYDAFGAIISQTDAKGQVTTVSHDTAGRILARNEPGLYSTWTYGTSSSSHNIGLPVEAKACTSSGCASVVSDRTFTFDSFGRPASSTLTTAGASYTYISTYNSDGQLSTVSHPSGLVLAYVYDGYGYKTQVKDGSSGTVYWTGSAANENLQWKSQVFGNGVTQTNTYNANTGAIASIRAGTSDAAAAFDYTFDGVGNLIYRSDNYSGTFEYVCYDSLGRLTSYAAGVGISSCTASGAKVVSYDALGNITSKSDAGTYSYPASGNTHPHAVSSISGTVNGVSNPSYSYDANGNMTAGAGRMVTYTAFNMVASIAQGSTSGALVYDSEHSRIQQTLITGSTTTVTTYLNDPISGSLSEKSAISGTSTWHDYIVVGGHLVAEKFSGGTAAVRYFITDHLGSVTSVMNESGGVVERNAYDAWGKRRKANGSDDSSCSLSSIASRGYTGHEHIDAECLINMNARIYDPTIGRFLSADTIIPDPFNTQSFNRYAYVGNHPLSAFDPTGHSEGDAYQLAASLAAQGQMEAFKNSVIDAYNSCISIGGNCKALGQAVGAGTQIYLTAPTDGQLSRYASSLQTAGFKIGAITVTDGSTSNTTYTLSSGTNGRGWSGSWRESLATVTGAVSIGTDSMKGAGPLRFGSNGKWYWGKKINGNQFFKVTKLGATTLKYLEFGGVTANAMSGVIDAWNFKDATGDAETEMAVADLVMDGVGAFGGPTGAALSASWYLTGKFYPGGKEQYVKDVGAVTTNSPVWAPNPWVVYSNGWGAY